MLCYKDRTFCTAECSTPDCGDKLTADVWAGARKWWGHDPERAPVAVSDFSGDCPDYTAPPTTRAGEEN